LKEDSVADFLSFYAYWKLYQSSGKRLNSFEGSYIRLLIIALRGKFERKYTAFSMADILPFFIP
jgi:hypothetical protein